MLLPPGVGGRRMTCLHIRARNPKVQRIRERLCLEKEPYDNQRAQSYGKCRFDRVLRAATQFKLHDVAIFAI